jgi:Holliday junction DNA helicase RuvA
MIGRLRGKLLETGLDSLILDVGGVGYELFASASTLRGIAAADGEIVLHTYLHVREDALQLFGFAEAGEKQLFELLISVSGVGPRVALSVLSAFSADDLAKAIATGDVGLICTVPGIGKKTAQRLVLELKDKLAGGIETGETVLTGVSQSTYEEARQALAGLGYSPVEAKKALDGYEADGEEPSTEELVKHALRNLSK